MGLNCNTRDRRDRRSEEPVDGGSRGCETKRGTKAENRVKRKQGGGKRLGGALVTGPRSNKINKAQKQSHDVASSL